MSNFATCSFNMKEEKENWKSWQPLRGEIYMVNLGDDNLDSEQNGLRPFVILSNNIGNKMGDIVVGCPLTSKRKPIPKIHVKIPKEYGLKMDSYVLTEHIRSVSKRRFFTKGKPIFITKLTEDKLADIKEAVMFELAL